MTGFTYLWEYQVAAGRQEEFERHYRPDGTWGALFSQGEGYIETLLLRDASTPLRYVTIDRWRSEASYRAFRAQFGRQYDDLDQLCEGLTTRESPLGEFGESAAAGPDPAPAASAMRNPYVGLYRGVVTNDLDPQGLMRIEVLVPAVLGARQSAWALPCVPPGCGTVPSIGAHVWIQFEAGDSSRPVWMGLSPA